MVVTRTSNDARRNPHWADTGASDPSTVKRLGDIAFGAQKPNEWVWDPVALILNARYNDKQTTIITTNYPDLPAGGGAQSDVERAAREQTLGDRIGDRMRSRLAEMCVRVEMKGEDFRQSVKRARFG